MSFHAEAVIVEPVVWTLTEKNEEKSENEDEVRRGIMYFMNVTVTRLEMCSF